MRKLYLPALSGKTFLNGLCFTLLFTAIFGLNGFGQAVPIWTNPITGTNPGTSNPYTTGDVKNANIAVSGIGRTGVVNQPVNDRYNFDSWGTGTTINTGKYFSFQLTP